MNENVNADRFTLRRLAFVLLVGAIVFPVMGLLGWLTGIQFLASFGAQFIPMAPSTLICFILLSAMLGFLLRQHPSRSVIIGSSVAGAFVGLYGFL
ncbi:MAG: hypothetical protein WCL71_18440, partial [Deltaproteobacteria bacterium]